MRYPMSFQKLVSILVSEIRRCENKAFPKKRPTYWDFESRTERGSVECMGRDPTWGAALEVDIV